MLEAVGVTKRYGDLTALDDINLRIEAGSVTALIGPSGCGKSTLLRAFIGLIEPDGGRVTLDGRELFTGDQREVRADRRRFGYVIQDGGLFPHLTARQNAALPAIGSALTNPEVNDRIDSLAQTVHLNAKMLAKTPGQLSGGQRQRVALLRALVLDPDIMLLDEPLGALDPVIRTELQSELLELFRRLEKTVVIVTHDLAEAAYFSQDIVLMQQGRIAERASLQQLAQSPEGTFARAFTTAQTSRVQSLLNPDGGTS